MHFGAEDNAVVIANHIYDVLKTSLMLLFNCSDRNKEEGAVLNTYFKELIKNNPIHSNLKNVCATIEPIDYAQYDVDVVECLKRIDFVISNFKYALLNCDERLTPQNCLDSANQQICIINQLLTNFINDNVKNHITNEIVGSLDILLRETAVLNLVKSKQNLQGYFSAVKRQEDMSNDLFNCLAEKVKKEKEELLFLENEIQKNKEDIDQLATGFSNLTNSAKAGFEAVIEDLKKQVNTIDEGINKSKVDLHGSFIENERKRENDYSEQKKSFSDGFWDLKNQIQKMTEKQAEDFKDMIDRNQMEINSYYEKARTMLGIIDANTFSAKYKKVADNARRRNIIWNVITVVSILGVAGFAWWAFIHSSDDSSWIVLISKILTAGTIGSLAAFSASQASKVEQVEKYARKIEMELVAIDPFLESLNEEKKEEIKSELAKKLFGNDFLISGDKKSEKIPKGSEILTPGILKIIQHFFEK